MPQTQRHCARVLLACVLKVNGRAKRKMRRKVRAGTRHCRYDRSAKEGHATDTRYTAAGRMGQGQGSGQV